MANGIVPNPAPCRRARARAAVQPKVDAAVGLGKDQRLREQARFWVNPGNHVGRGEGVDDLEISILGSKYVANTHPHKHLICFAMG